MFESTPQTNRVYLYAMDEQYNILAHCYVRQQFVTVRELTFQARCLLDQKPNVIIVYAADSSYECYRGYLKSVQGNLDDRVVFKDMLDKIGIRVV